ncbi:hypothetical protein ACFVQB_09560 [Paenibacillus sp. NPDC057886]|uniref:hypothetical protein n=1 Tax=Paenibacillus sp. NPDC057886 TaxID=3346270 RepID=UPI0036A3CE8B
MLVYENQFPVNCFTLLPVDVKQHIMGIVDASPTSQFYCHVTTEIPNVNVYLIEHNPSEIYTICHFFSYDQIGEDYSYQSLSSNQINMMNQFVLQANIT